MADQVRQGLSKVATNILDVDKDDKKAQRQKARFKQQKQDRQEAVDAMKQKEDEGDFMAPSSSRPSFMDRISDARARISFSHQRNFSDSTSQPDTPVSTDDEDDDDDALSRSPLHGRDKSATSPARGNSPSPAASEHSSSHGREKDSPPVAPANPDRRPEGTHEEAIPDSEATNPFSSPPKALNSSGEFNDAEADAVMQDLVSKPTKRPHDGDGSPAPASKKTRTNPPEVDSDNDSELTEPPEEIDDMSYQDLHAKDNDELDMED